MAAVDFSDIEEDAPAKGGVVSFDDIQPEPSALKQISKLMPGAIGQHPLEPFVPLPRIQASDLSPTAAEALMTPIGARLARNVTGDTDAPQKIVAGAERGLAGVLEGVETPLGAAALAIPFLKPVIGRAISGGFAAHMAHGTPQLARDLGTAVGERDLGKTIESGIGLAANTAFAAGAGAHAIRPKSPVVADIEKIAGETNETIPKAEVEPLKPKEPVTDVFDEVAAEPVAAAEPAPVPVEQKVEAPVEQPEIAAPFEPVVEPPKTPIELVNTAPKVKVSAPDGSTTIRATDSKGRVSTQPASAFKGANPLKGADIVKLEAGTIDKTGKFKAMEGPISVGPGAQTVGEIAPAQLAQLTDSLTRLAGEAGAKQSKAFDLGEALATARDATGRAMEGLKAAGTFAAKKFEGKPEWTDIKEIVGERHLELSESVYNAKRFSEKALRDVPDKTLQEAISNFVDTGGDMARLKVAATEGPARYRKGYERAMKLSEAERVTAANIKNYFEARLEEAQRAGILEDGIENYIHRVYEGDTPWKRSVLTELGNELSSATPSLAKKRVFEFDMEAEAAGLTPIKSFIKRIFAYDVALNKAIADRKAIKALMGIKMKDGRPAIDVAGRGNKIILKEEAEGSATFIDPKWKPTDPDTPMKYRGDYEAVDSPALRKWKWVSSDYAGNPTFVKGDVLVHPDALGQVRALVEKSKIRYNPANPKWAAVGRAALDTSSTVKQTMLDLSMFHLTQIAVHGFEHRSFRPAKSIDFTNPQVRGLVKGGMVVGETSGRMMFDEGLAGSSLTQHIPGFGKYVTAFKDYLFQSFIPRLKISTGLHALERNRQRYPNLTEAELYHKTATQMNNAFGGLNYEMMGRSRTMQDVLRLSMLAPDFLEARGRFAADATTKYGREQLEALAFGAVGMYVMARIINKLVSDQYHFEPENAFSVIYKGKAYGLRTVQGDMLHLAVEPMHFIRNRLNPVITRPVLEAFTGRDEFGRKRTAGQQFSDWLTTAVPISIKGAFQGREKSLFESLINSMGLTVRRETADTSIRKKFKKWSDDHPEIVRKRPGELVYNPEDDIYRPILLAARANDAEGIRKEIKLAIENDKTKRLKYRDVLDHFKRTATSPMGGSFRIEREFVRSLSADERKTFEESNEERLQIYRTIRQAGR